MDIKNILIFGGTGAMGKYVVDLLAKEGHAVSYTSRKNREESRSNVTCMVGNAKDNRFLEEILKKHWDVIIDFMVYSTEEFQERVERLLSSAGQYIFISSARVYADCAGKITEESPRLLDVCADEAYLATDEYALSKARQEDELFHRKASGEALNWTIVRPSLTYSSGRLQLGVYEKESWLRRALLGKKIVFSRDLMNRYYTMTAGEDVAKGIAALAGRSECFGEAYHIVTDQSYQWKDILKIYLDVLEEELGSRPKVYLTETCTNLSFSEGRYQVLYGRYFNRHFDNSKIAGYVDVSAFENPAHGLSRCLREFLKQPEFGMVYWRLEAIMDRICGESTSLSDIPGWKNKAKYFLARYIPEIEGRDV